MARRSPLRRLFALLLGLLLLWQVWLFAHVLAYRWIDPRSTAFMDQGRIRTGASPTQQWVDYAQISPHLIKAVVAAEDSTFTTHAGFDWDGMRDAFQRNLKRGKIVAGGSTISQQLAKNLFLSPRRNPVRKLQEAVITVMLETCLDKRRILEIYLNVIEWGDNLYGIEAASRHYFRTPASRLSPAQASRLAAMIPAPRYFQRHPASRALSIRSAIYQRRLHQVAVPPLR